MQSGALEQTGLLVKYLRSLTMKNFMASGAKRAAIAGTEYALVRMLVPGALASSVTYLATSTAGTVGKNVVSYGLQTGTGADTEVYAVIPKSEVENLQREIRRHRKWSWNPTKLPSAVASTVKEKAVGTCTHVINLSYQDMSEGTGALIGSTAATAGMLFFLGPPSWFALPLYLLVEGGAKSVCAFIGKHFGRWYIGPNVFKPAIKSAWHAIHGSHPAQLQEAIDEMVYQVREIDIGESPCTDKELEDLQSAWAMLEVTPDLQEYAGAGKESEDAERDTDTVRLLAEAPKPIIHTQSGILANYMQNYDGNQRIHVPEEDCEDLQAPPPKYLTERPGPC